MPKSKTPGQVAYEAYMVALNGGSDNRWEHYADHLQAAWECAAEAVLATASVEEGTD